MRQGSRLEVEAVKDLSALDADVRSLFDAAEADDPQFGLDWFRNLVTTVLGHSGDWTVYVLRRDGAAIAAMPLMADPAGHGKDLRSLGNYYTTLFALPVRADLQASELATLLSGLRSRQGPLRSLNFLPLDGVGRTAALLRQALRLAGYWPFEYDCFGNWYLPVSGSGDAYLASRPGEVRSTLRRMGRKFSEAGGRIEIVTTATPEHIDAFVGVYATSWKQPEPYPAFMPGLIRLCSERQWLRLGLAWAGARPVAAQLWMVAGSKASIYKLAYDPGFRQFSPGSLLTAALMKHVIDQDRVAEVDYLSGDDAYKQAWMTHRRQRIGMVAYNPRALGGLWGAARQTVGDTLRPALTRLKQRRDSAAA